MAFFVLGMYAGYAIYFPELFPRGSGPPARASASTSAGCWAGYPVDPRRAGPASRHAPGRRGHLVPLLGRPVILYFAPETRGRELTE